MIPTPYLGSTLSYAEFLLPQAVAVATTVKGPSASTGLNIKGASGTGLIIAYGKNGASAGCTIDAKLTECSTTNGSYTDVAGVALTQVALTNSLTHLQAIPFKWAGRAAFLRWELTTGAGTNGPIGVGAVLVYGGLANLS